MMDGKGNLETRFSPLKHTNNINKVTTDFRNTESIWVVDK